jgi:dihydrofolate reductase
MFMGGSGIYAEALSHANRLYLTEVYAEVSGDVYFPEFGRDEWVELEREDHSADEKNDHDYSFVVLERV